MVKIIRNHILTTSELYILLALTGDDMHAYGIKEKVRLVTKGRHVITDGTLYPTMKRLERWKLIEQVDTLLNSTNVARNVFTLTSLGKTLITEEAQALKQLSERVTV